ncbi:MAG: hypothetical protein BWY87_01189 [Deltaproteobacteria bacterium ADurb.Bin510]|nr:MAG: hypothetical protein BWY87_01189 [Deltaproteobacteria bacterium ADurb.Bin510]
MRVVEREQPRLDLGKRQVADRTAVVLGEELPVVLIGLDQHLAAGKFAGHLDRIVQARSHALFQDDAVDHDLDGVLLLLVEPWHLAQVVGLAIDAHAHEAVARQVVEELGVLALAAADHRRIDDDLAALAQGADRRDHLLDGHALDRPAALKAARRADAGIQHAQVVVDLGDRAHGRARVVGSGLLFDRDRGRETFDRIDLGLGHLVQKLAGVGAQ